MNWDDLRFFLALARSGTLTEAAQVLGVSHTTVSRRVAALSDAGTQLFLKTPEGYSLTAAGEALLKLADHMEGDAAAAERLLTGADARLAGRLVVTTIDLLVSPFTPLFSKYATTYPSVELVLSVDNRAVSLTRREADVALRFSNAPPEHLVGRRLRHYDWAPCAAPSLVQRHGDDLPSYPWLGWVEPLAPATERWIKATSGTDRRVARFDTAGTMVTMLQAGLGASTFPIDLAAHFGLTPITGPIDDFGMDLWVLTHPDLKHAARVKAFMELAADVVARLDDEGDRSVG